MHYQVDWKTLWRYPVCGVMLVLGTILIIVGSATGASILLQLLGMALGIGGMLLHRHLSNRENERRAITKVRAKVLYQTRGQQQGSTYVMDVWFLTFETESGEALEFEVSEQDCNRWQTGDEGTLRYRGGQFLSFGNGWLSEGTD